MDDITIDTSEIERVFRSMGSRAARPPMNLVAEELKVAVDDVLQAQGAIGGGKQWDGFRPSTLRRNPRRQGGMLLQRTGLLANFQTRHGTNFAEIRSPASYAGFHITGTRNMAQRDFFAIDWDKTLELMGNVVLDDIDRSGS